MNIPGAELPSALWAGYRPLCPSPVPGDARLAEVMHAGQHDWVPEQVAADGTCQVLPQTAFGRCGSSHCTFPCRGVRPQSGSETKSLEEDKHKTESQKLHNQQK